MKQVLYTRDIAAVLSHMDHAVLSYLNSGQIETFESFRTFDILAFDWYDIYDLSAEPSQMMIYIDRDDVFFLCENDLSYQKAVSVFKDAPTNERAVYEFFLGLIRGDTRNLETLEGSLIELEDSVITGKTHACVPEIVRFRRELLRLKKYYEQLQSIFEELTENDNGLFSEDSLRWFEVLSNRVDRLLKSTINLRDYVTQVREAYQAQLDIQANNIMKVFTVVTSVFLPLSLITGWYGMNFVNMPELTWQGGYPTIIGVCVAVVAGLLIMFKRKKWI